MPLATGYVPQSIPFARSPPLQSWYLPSSRVESVISGNSEHVGSGQIDSQFRDFPPFGSLEVIADLNVLQS